MRAQNDAGRRTRRRWTAGAVGTTALLVLTGCSAEVQRGWYPGTRDTTNYNAQLTDLWVNSWIAAMVVGLLAWGAMIWCMVAYRRRKNDQGFPKQTAYNVPLETMFTAIPILMVFTLWGFTDRVQTEVDRPVDDSPLTVTVYGKQWSWDFNYSYEQENGEVIEAHYSGIQAQLDGTEGVRDTLPVLYLPNDVPVHFELKSRDVAHSFWIPQFLQKRDMVPGKTNHLYLTPRSWAATTASAPSCAASSTPRCSSTWRSSTRRSSSSASRRWSRVRWAKSTAAIPTTTLTAPGRWSAISRPPAVEVATDDHLRVRNG